MESTPAADAARNEDEARVLIVGSSFATGGTIQAALAEAGRGAFSIEHVPTLADACDRLEEAGIEAVLVDLELPDSQGLSAVETLFRTAPHIPIIVLGSVRGEDLFEESLALGAQDYVRQDHLDSYTLARALNGAIARKCAEDKLFVEKERAQVTLNSIGDAVLSSDLLGRISYLNIVAERMTGWTCSEAIGRPITEVFRVVDAHTHLAGPNAMERAVAENRTVGLSANSVLIRRDGTEFHIEDSAAPIHDRRGHVAGAVTVFHDVSESRSLMHRMSHLAQHDFLTDLPNRLLLQDRVEHSIALARRHGTQFAILFLDLDHLKHINDSLGHSVGDQLLKSIAARLVGCVRASDTVSRQGGDEFVVLLSEIAHASDAALAAEKMRAIVETPCLVGEHDLQVSVSIGISVYPSDGADAEALVKNADTAMYQAKESGRNNYRFFTAAMNARAVERQSIEQDLRRALVRKEFVITYQPEVDLVSRAITGAEALLRWRHPQRGLTYPDQFISIAEDSGLIVAIGEWVMREACAQAQAWIDAGLVFERMSVNISSVELRSPGFTERVCAILQETGLAPVHLELELTETVVMKDVRSASVLLRFLSDMGVRMAIDDFGTGYSSLDYIKRLPIDTLKIDRSFVRDVFTSQDDATIVGTMIAMGKSLRQRIVAEGVETEAQLRFLQSHRCAEGQGYYFSHPLPAHHFETLLSTGIPAPGSDTHPVESV